MSLKLIAEALQQKLGNPQRKLVLIKLADNASDDGYCFPSYHYLAEECEITRRSAMNHIQALIDEGFVSRQRQRNGKRNRVNLYRVHLTPAKGGETDSPQGSENSSPGGETDSPQVVNEFHGGGETDSPGTCHGNQSLGTSHGSGSRKRDKLDLSSWPESVDEQAASDWLQHRKAIKCPASQTVVNQVGKELHRCVERGIDPNEALAEALAAGWRGFKADWLENRLGKKDQQDDRPRRRRELA